MLNYEIRYHDEFEWHRVSEITFMQDLVDCFEHIAPIINELLQGVEISTSRGIYRVIKKEAAA